MLDNNKILNIENISVISPKLLDIFCYFSVQVMQQNSNGLIQ